MKISQAEWAGIRQQFIDHATRQGVSLRLRDRVWAVSPKGEWVALPGSSDSPNADSWWLGCDPQKLHARRAAGVILLCQARGGSLHTIGLPARILRDVEGRLSKNKRQTFFNVVRRGGRFLLKLRGGDEMDVTGRLNDLSWLTKGDAEGALLVSDGVNEGSERPALFQEDAAAPEKHPEEVTVGMAPVHRFFAIAKNGALQPLDDVALQPGSVYLVEARPSPAVPGNSSLRRIVARGGPHDLPGDFAERHDYYAHGAIRR